MPIGTISNIIWADDAARPLKGQVQLRARRCSLPRCRQAFVAVELAILAAVLLFAIRIPQLAGLLLVVAAAEFFFHLNGLDRSILRAGARRFYGDVARSVVLAALVAGTGPWLFPQILPGAGIAVAAAAGCAVIPLAMRPVLKALVARRKLVTGVLIVGTPELTAKLDVVLQEVCQGAEKRGDTNVMVVECGQLRKFLARENISLVVIAERNPHRQAELAASIMECRLRGVGVCDAVDFYEQLSGRIWLEGLHPQWLFYTGGFHPSRATLAFKRFFDVVFCSVLLAVCAPLLLIIAIAIKLNSPGPVLFRQVRVGLYGRAFVLYKFRSMRQDAETETGPVWAAAKDDRVTRVGELLRKFRLDEIPQAFNVLRGEMSVVGPRPERPFFVRMLERRVPCYNLRHYVKPGITGWAQVTYHYGSSIEDACQKLQYDLYYAKHSSAEFDLEILLRTLRIVLLGRGR
jgi:sugar transferase (PEP-CTERM system associated)